MTVKLDRPLKSTHVIFRLTKPQLDKLKELAYSEGCNVGEYVRSVIRTHLSKVEKKEG